jgi:hypothetical protein
MRIRPRVALRRIAVSDVLPELVLVQTLFRGEGIPVVGVSVAGNIILGCQCGYPSKVWRWSRIWAMIIRLHPRPVFASGAQGRLETGKEVIPGVDKLLHAVSL